MDSNIQNLTLFYMADQVIESKTDNDLLSSRMESQASTARPIYRLGWAPIYISPKIIQDEGNSYETKIFSQNKIELPSPSPIPIPAIQNSNHAILTERKQATTQKIQQTKQVLIPQKTITFTKFNHIVINIIESIIFCTFLLGSFTILQQFVYIDYFGNMLCLFKIILYHLFIFIYNSQTEFNEPQQNPDKISTQHKKFYINRLQLYQLIQIWSLCCTLCLFLAIHNPTIYGIISSVRLIRLFFIFFVQRKKQNKWRAKVFLHILKITIGILICTLLFAIAMQLFLYNIQNYFCMQSIQMVGITVGTFPPTQFQTCGISKYCPVSQNCRNIYSFTQNQMQKRVISQFLLQKSASFSKNLLVSILTVLSIGGSYNQYKKHVMQWVLLPLIAIIWLLYVAFTGIGIGEAIGFQSMQNWKRSKQIQRIQQQNNKKKQKQKRKLKKRNSNISFSSTKIVRQKNSQSSQIQNSPQVTQFSKQIIFIEQQLKNRSIKQKIMTILFNLASLTQVVFVIVQNLNISPWVTTVSGVSLGVIFILWTFGLAFAIYQRITNSNSQQNNTNKYQNYVLLYQIVTYSLTSCDYLLRIILHHYLFESSTQITPFSQAAISLRIIYILFNNGFDAHISYLTEKIIQNFINNKLIIGFMIIMGMSIGFVLSYNFEFFTNSNQIQLVSMTISMVYGANGSIPTKNLLLCMISFILACIGIVVNFYLAKHINMGYDSILNIDFSQQSMQLDKKDYREQQNAQQSSSQNVIRKKFKNIVQYHYYYKVKTLIIVIYVILTLVYQQPTQNNNVQAVKFTIDVFLIVDLIAQFVAYGLSGQQSYLWEDSIPKCLYIASQIFLFITYFLHNVQRSLINSLRVSRGFILFGCIPELNCIYILIKTILLHKKIKIYKIVLLSIPLMLIGMCLSSPYVGFQAENNEASTKFLNMIAFSTSFVYNMGWSFVGKGNSLNFSYLSVDLIFVSVILFLHVILTFMMVTFFVNRKVKAEGDISQQILRQYETTDPQFYHFDTTNDRTLYAYLKVLKIIIILVSIVLLGMLSGGWLEYSSNRIYVTVVNLFLCFVQIMIYLMENMFIKQGIHRWPISQILLLGLSLPGSFFIAFPPIRFSNNLQINIIVRVFLFFSVLRVLRLFCLLRNRSIKQLSSQLLRRISKQLYFGQALGIFFFIVISILPFSTFQANISNSECPEQFIKFLTGSIFPNSNIRLVQLIPKIICTWFILFPIRTMLLARIISSLLSNKPNELLFLRDQIANVISQSQSLEKLNEDLVSKQTFYISFNRIYSFSAQIDRIFQQFTSNNKQKCLNYEQIMKKINRMNIPLYKFTYSDRNQYGLLIYDIIWNFYQEYKKSQGGKTQQPNTRSKISEKPILEQNSYWLIQKYKEIYSKKQNKQESI